MPRKAGPKLEKIGVWLTAEERESLYSKAREVGFTTFVSCLRAVASGDAVISSTVSESFAAMLHSKFFDNRAPDVQAAIRTLIGASVISDLNKTTPIK